MPIAGWGKHILWIDLSRRTYFVSRYDGSIAQKFVGGRGLAAKILWDHLEPGTNPLGPRNLLVLAVGPLTAIGGLSTAKLVVASKSPLTGGYGEGSLGTRVAVYMRQLGLDAIVISGASDKPVYVVVDGKCSVEFHEADWMWGLTTWEAEERLHEIHGREAGILTIGPAGERLVPFATIISGRFRSGGRPGLGAVMGSKKLKAIVLEPPVESNHPPVYDARAVQGLLAKAVQELTEKPQYPEWRRLGTLATLKWAQEHSVLPSYNFREGVFEHFESLWKSCVAKLRSHGGCPLCCMPCGHIVVDAEGAEAELDYEGVAMLGPNIGLSDLERIAVLVRLADEYGMDVISLGNVMAHLTEAYELGLLKNCDYELWWGSYHSFRRLVREIALRQGLGALASKGVKRLSEELGSLEFAMHVKGLEVSAYDCHAAPAMALAYATSPLGAHHKDAWVISWEVSYGREKYDEVKVQKVIELQRVRGGIFETLCVCRFPWVELGLDLEYYLRLFHAVTGHSMSLNEFYVVADRVYALIRIFWARELGYWSPRLDMPPQRWFKHKLSKGPLKGAHLDLEAYKRMLRAYYRARGWGDNGLPTARTLKELGLSEMIHSI